MLIKLLILTLLTIGFLVQAGTTSLVWEDTRNPVGSSYSVYRSSNSCASTSLFAKIANSVTAKTYEDLNVGPGVYCYRVTANFNGLESLPSNSVEVTIPLFAPTALSATTK